MIEEIWRDGVLVEVIGEDSEPLPLLGMEYFLSLGPEEQQAILVLAGGLVQRAGEIWDNTVLIPEEDASKEVLKVVAEVALEAALPLL